MSIIIILIYTLVLLKYAYGETINKTLGGCHHGLFWLSSLLDTPELLPASL